ncbi:MAG TPA: undecaprenyl-diphosphatase UppP [Pyrinomonadaceae bacterium]|nr:undecaprenyl-diphosphatase UppP [Pyrinomonadaceae bacterium]
MSILQALVLGIVQGLTEFIPISSTAHLVLAGRVMNLSLNAEQTTATIAVIQLGTLLAVLIYFARDMWNISHAFMRDHLALLRGERSAAALEIRTGTVPHRLSQEARLGWLVIIGSLPVGIVGLLFKRQIEGTFTKNLWVIATMLIAVALLLLLAEMTGKRKRTMADLGLIDALAVGGAQVLALIPGASRSGSTIMGGLFVGETRETAARFSFLLSIPAIAASGLLELKEAIERLPAENYLPLAVSTIVAGVVGYASIWFLLYYLRTHSTNIFIGYRVVVGVIILALLFGGIIRPLDESQVAVGAAPQAAAAVQEKALDSEPSVTMSEINANKNRQDSVNSSRPSSKRGSMWSETGSKGRSAL